MNFLRMVFATLLCFATAFGVDAAEGRRLLTMEDAILNHDLVPKNYHIEWNDACAKGEYLHCTPEGEWQAIDVRTGKVRKVEPPQPVSKVAHAELRENNIVWVEADGSERRVTDFEDKNIVCGATVSRNEFGISGGLFPSPDGRRLAFYKKDESRVTTFPLLDITTRTGSLFEIKYPMNGMPSERIEVGVYNVETGESVYLNVTDFDEERYITNLTWSPDSERIYAQVLDRAQKNMHLNLYDATSGAFIKTLLTEHDDRFVEPQYPLYFLRGDASKFIYTTNNRDGYRNLYLYSLADDTLTRLTKVDADVEYVGQCERAVYYYSAEQSPVERHLMRKDLRTGRVQQLTRDEGWHTCSLSTDARLFSDNYSSLDVPRVVAVGTTDGKVYREVFRAENPAAEFNFAPIELGTVRSADGKYDNYYRLIKPLDFDPAKKYPVILYVYGGPHSQMVRNSFQAQLRRWEMYMAQRGWVVFVMDNRGTQNRGAEFERAIHGRCGVCEMEDQMAGMRWLMSHEWVDTERIGVHGWSYGGFMTISLMVNYPDVFKVGVAGGPVIDWKWYEVMYGERYMETEATNANGFAATSLLPRAKDLRGRLLICQGAVDDVVLWQHSLNFVQECIKANVPVDYFPYPRAQHNVRGKHRVHLMHKVTDYFEDFLR
ncbi:MAG: DPP IV N-terminal domain-containing protein [Alistipes sp.]|nr:DPP IV N-terminal domain-containing protein [Alistipes sp.]